MLYQQIKDQIKDAMRAKDELRKEVLRGILSAFVNQVVSFAELDATVEKTAARLLGLPHLALEKIKAGLNQHLYSALADALEFEAVNQDECFHSADFIEGITAFMQKRKAIFNQDLTDTDA